MASGNPNLPSALPNNNNYAYSQSVHVEDDDEFLSEHIASIGLAEVTMPLSWDEGPRPVNLNARTSANCPVDSRLEESPFILSASATCHISPELSDFKTLSPILPRPVKLLSGTLV
jgi:hypothetical protein